MESFVILIAEGYTSKPKNANELFKIISAKAINLPPPFDVEVVVANGQGIRGEVLIFYLEDTFDSCPKRLGSFNFNSDFLQSWLHKIITIDSPDYIIEFHGPRNCKLEDYLPGINIVSRKRLSGKDVVRNFIDNLDTLILSEKDKQSILKKFLTKEQFPKLFIDKDDALLSDFGIKLISVADEQRFRELIKQWEQ